MARFDKKDKKPSEPHQVPAASREPSPNPVEPIPQENDPIEPEAAGGCTHSCQHTTCHSRG